MAKKKNQNNRELDELDRAYQDLTGTDPKQAVKKKNRTPLMGLLCGFAVLILCFAAGCGYFLSEQEEPTVPTEPEIRAGSISAAGIDLEGMTKDEVRDALGNTAYSREPMLVTVETSMITLSPADTGAALDVDAAVEAIFENDGAAGQFDLLPYLNLDTAYIRQAVEQLGSRYNTPLTETVWTVDGEMPSLAYADRDMPCQTLVITMGTPESSLDVNALYQQVLDAYNSGIFRVEGNCNTAEPAPLDLEALHDQFYTAPVDAVKNNQTNQITPEQFGYGFDLDSAKALLTDAGYGETVEIPFERIAPSVTSESLTVYQFPDVLGSYSTPHTSDANRNTNLRLACKAINGVVLMPGESFSYNQTLGKRTAAKGYKPAASYVGGQTMDTLGGGICQVSTTLYYSAVLADLTITTRACHSYAPTYTPRGTDAMVSWGTQDFKFRNSSKYPIRIVADVSGGHVNVKILGTDDRDYYVKLEAITTEETDYETVYKTYSPDNSKGYQDGDVITTPYKGYKAVSYRCKYDKTTGELISRKFEASSTYRTRNEVICRIEGATVPTEPETTPPETTEPTQPTETTAPPETTEPTQPPETTAPPETTEPTQPPETTAPPETTEPTQPPETTAPPETTEPTQPTETTAPPETTEPTPPTDASEPIE